MSDDRGCETTVRALERLPRERHMATTVPRRDVALKTLLPAADKILAEMRGADS